MTSFEPDTTLGGRNDRFPATRHSVLKAASSRESTIRRQALADVIDAYWKPVYKHVRLHWRKSNDQAKDLTQGFFASLLERELIERYDPSRAAFRTYLRTCVDSFVLREAETASRLKRGGRFTQLDFESAEREIQLSESVEDIFDREWRRQLFSLGIADLRRECEDRGKQLHYRIFESYDLADHPPAYESLARQFGIPVTTVTNHLAWARRELRRLVLTRLESVTATDREFRREARLLLQK